MEYTEEYIRLCRRFAELMQVEERPYSGYWKYIQDTDENILVSIDEYYTEHGSRDFEESVFKNEEQIEVIIPPLSWLVRELGKRSGYFFLQPTPPQEYTRNSMEWECATKNMEIDGRIYFSLPQVAPTPEGACVKALTKILEERK